MQESSQSGRGAVAALEALSQETDEVQQKALPDEVVHLWAAATSVAPERALDWWEGPDHLGALLRDNGDPSGLISAWMRLPPASAFQRLDSRRPLGRRLLRILPPGALLTMWRGDWEAPHQGHPVHPEERMEAWRSDDLRGRRLRRDVPVEAVVPVWQESAEDSPLEAFELLGAEDLLGRGLRRSLEPGDIVQAWKRASIGLPYLALQALRGASKSIKSVLSRHLTLKGDILPAWRRLAVQFPVGALEHYITAAPLGKDLRGVIDPDEAVALWRSTPEPWLGIMFLERAPSAVRAALRQEDLLPLIESEVSKCREAGIKWFGQVGGAPTQVRGGSRTPVDGDPLRVTELRILGEFDDVLKAIRDVKGSDALVVGVEGASGCGKSTLAERLFREIPAALVRTDAFYEQGVVGETYQEGLRLPELKERLSAVTSGTGIVVVEGICLRDTLGKIDHGLDMSVYCKRLSRAGVWHDAPEVAVSVDRDSPYTQGRIDYWSHEYHLRVLPHKIADVVYEWREET